MGRKKIEIQPITDERNRSITFVKRKAGLFKKAHELAVLCQVDLAVIIVNNNNNSVFEFSSGNVSSILDKYANAPSIHRDSSFSGDYDENGKFQKRNMSQHEDTDSDQESSFHDIKRHRALSPNMVNSSKQTYAQNYPNPNNNLVNKFGYVNGQQQNLHLMPNNQSYLTSNNAAAADSVFAAAAAVSSSMNGNSNSNNPVNNRFNQYQKLPMVSSKLGQFEESNNNNNNVPQNSLGIYSNDTSNGHLNMQTSTPNLNQNPGPTAGTLLSASSSSSSNFLFPTPAAPASMNTANNPITKINTNVPAFNSPYNNSTATFSSIASPSYTNRSTPSSARPVLKVQIPADKDAKKPDMSSSNSMNAHSMNNNNNVGSKLPILEENSTGEKLPISATLPSALFLPLGSTSSNSKENNNKQPPTAGLMSSTIRPLLFGGNNSTSSLNNNNSNSSSGNNNINVGEQTPVSGFPLMSARFGDGSRYMNEFFPSPSNYYGEWNVPNASAGVGNGLGTTTASASNGAPGALGISGGDDETPVKLVPGNPVGTPSSVANAGNFGANKDSVSSSSSSTASGNNAAAAKKDEGPSTSSSATVFSGPVGTIGAGVAHNGAAGIASNATNGTSLNTMHNNGSSSSDLSKHSLNNPNGSVKDELPSPIGFPSGMPFGKLKRGDTAKSE